MPFAPGVTHSTPQWKMELNVCGPRERVGYEQCVTDFRQQQTHDFYVFMAVTVAVIVLILCFEKRLFR